MLSVPELRQIKRRIARLMREAHALWAKYPNGFRPEEGEKLRRIEVEIERERAKLMKDATR